MEKNTAIQLIDEKLFDHVIDSDCPCCCKGDYIPAEQTKFIADELLGLYFDIVVSSYIAHKGYDWTFKEIMDEYEKYNNNCYVSHTAKDVIENCIKVYEI